jgi:hypothetical protein
VLVVVSKFVVIHLLSLSIQTLIDQTEFYVFVTAFGAPTL